tara:strand:- start:1601 stop:1822 length:222 start_codon:yes stop_codon:yes gene_type:complete
MDITKADIEKADMGTLITMWLMLEFFKELNCEKEFGEPYPIINSEDDFYYVLFEWQKFLNKRGEILTMYRNKT